MIVCTGVLIGKKWVESPVTYALIGILAALLIILIVAVAYTRSDTKRGRRHLALYGKLIKLFKASVTIVFLVLSAIALAGVARSEPGALGWLTFAVTFLIAALQLAFQITLLILNFYHKRVGKKYEVKVVRFVDGKPKESKTINKIYSKIYKNDDDYK